MNYIPNDHKSKGRSSERPFLIYKHAIESFIRKKSEQAAFLIKYPFVLGAFKWRQHKEWRRIIPHRWLSPAQVIAEDLEMIELNTRSLIDQKFIDDFVKSRDDLMNLIKKQIIISFLIFLFLISNDLNIGLDINLGGFSLRYSKGIAEGLLLICNLLSCYTLILQANCYTLEATIKSAIQISIPEELRSLYLARYFSHEQFGRYQPFNMPYLIPTGMQRFINKWVALLFITLLFLTYLGYAACNLSLLIYHLWIIPSFGLWSNALLIYILICGFCAIFYVALTRFRLPYRDYIVNSELELLEQIDPDLHKKRLQEIYGRLNEDRMALERRGYIKSIQ